MRVVVADHAGVVVADHAGVVVADHAGVVVADRVVVADHVGVVIATVGHHRCRMPLTRPLTIEDAEQLLELFRVNREFLTPWMPAWRPEIFTLAGQRRAIEALTRDQEVGRAVPHVILAGDRIVGRVTLSNIMRGALQSCTLGYWVSAAENGRGLATAAVAEMAALAFDGLRLHRIEAGVLTHNTASQRVLEHNGFSRIGVAERYLQIAGEWQDHILFQRIAPDG